jgi:hypothetical protein
VDSEGEGRVIEPRNARLAEVVLVSSRATVPERRNGLARGLGRGQRARHTSKGSSRNLGGPSISAEENAGEGSG